MKNGRIKTVFGAISLCLALLLPAGCTKPVEPSPAPDAAPTPAAATDTPTPTAPGEEELIYMPAYEVYPPDMDPLYTRSAVEKDDGLWFVRQVQDQGEMYYALMRGGKDAADPVTVVAFDPDV